MSTCAQNITVMQGTVVATAAPEFAVDAVRANDVASAATIDATNGRNVKMLLGSIVFTVTPIALFLFSNAMSVV